MSKFKFGDKVTYRSCKKAFYLVKTDEKNSLIAVEKNGVIKGAVVTVFTDELTPASDWVKCSERMPDCDELRERPHKARFWIYIQWDDGYILNAYRKFQNGEWVWASQLRTNGQMIFADAVVSHYMPITPPTPPQGNQS